MRRLVPSARGSRGELLADIAELRANSGEVTLVRLDFSDNLVHIDGGKVYRTAAEICP